MSIFETATRAKLRFPYKGMVSTEDLWDLNVKQLDSIFKTLNAQAKQASEDSLLTVHTAEDRVLDTQIAVVKHIVSVKLAEEQTRAQAAERREKKQKIMEIIASKQDADLQNKSADELQQMLNELE